MEPIRSFFMTTRVDPQGLAESMWLIIALPLLGALVCGVFGRYLGRANVHLIACASIAGAFLLSLLCFWTINDPVHIWAPMPATGEQARYVLAQSYGTWFSAGGFVASYGLLVDHLSGTLMLVITGVGFLIHVYSTSYMEHDEGYWRYFAYLNLFVAMMLTLVMGDNLVLTFVGWEGVGMASYLLIGFWYTDAAKAWAGRKAFITNRVGDFGFLIGMFLLTLLMGAASAQMKYGDGVNFQRPELLQRFQREGIQQAGPLNYNVLETFSVALSADMFKKGPQDQAVSLDQTINTGPLQGRSYGGVLTFILLCFLLGAAGKSAQLPLYVWLPDAMAGPTPVSALIHAATMVTAGVYLFARLNFLLVLSPVAMMTVATIGGLTALFAALIAFAQDDIKKVLAYSTVSQLGFMFMAVGMGVFWAAVLHLVTHAFFKACLFLGAGSVMHGNGDETNIKKLGGLRREIPWTWLTFLIATLAITGVVPLSGFFSKDAILHGIFESQTAGFPHYKYFIWSLGLAAAFCTAFYMTRLYWLTFEGERSKEAKLPHAHESAWQMTSPLAFLATCSVVTALYGIPYLSTTMGHQTVMENFLYPVFESGNRILATLSKVPEGVENPEWLGSLLTAYGIAWAIALLGVGLAVFAYTRYFPSRRGQAAPAFARSVRSITQHKFYVDELYELVIIRPIRFASYVFFKVIDTLFIDTIAVRGTAWATARAGSLLRYAQTGDAQNYATVMALALLAGVGYALFQVLR